jgi:hypothetical protein
VSTEAEQEQFAALTVRRKMARALALRARIDLPGARCTESKSVAARHRVTQQIVSKWRAQSVGYGLDGLLDALGSGTARAIDDERVDAVVGKSLESVPEGASRWSTRLMVCELGMSQIAVSRIWRAFALQPRWQEAFNLSADPLIVGKVRVVGLYVDLPHLAMVLCVDEKSQIQALGPTRLMLPLAPKIPKRPEQLQQARGTTTLAPRMSSSWRCAGTSRSTTPILSPSCGQVCRADSGKHLEVLSSNF